MSLAFILSLQHFPVHGFDRFYKVNDCKEKAFSKQCIICELQNFSSLNEETVIPNKTLICYLKTVVGGR